VALFEHPMPYEIQTPAMLLTGRINVVIWCSTCTAFQNQMNSLFWNLHALSSVLE